MLRTTSSGFSLLETLLATSIVTIALSALVQLFVVSARANTDARKTTRAAVLAREKMEQLRGERGAAGGALDRDVDGYFDLFDDRGRALGGDAPPDAAAFLRRWTIEGPLTRPPGAYALQVIVRPIQHASSRSLTTGRPMADERLWGGAHLVAVRPSREVR